MKRRERITDAIQRDYAITAITVCDYARLRDYGDSYNNPNFFCPGRRLGQVTVTAY